MKPLRTTLFLISLTASLITVNGCSTTNVYVLDEMEVQRIQEGQTFTSKYKGWLLSDRAVKRVEQVRMIKTNLE